MPAEAAVGFDALYGLELVEVTAEVASGRVAVSDELRQPTGLVHGGVYAAIAESLASYGTAVAVMPEGRLAMGLSNHTSFLRPITGGTIHATARPRHRGRSTWVWEVEPRRRRRPALRPRARHDRGPRRTAGVSVRCTRRPRT